MPCIGGPIGSCIDDSEVMALRDKLQKSIHERDNLTRMLCELCGKLKEENSQHFWYDLASEELKAWWDKHQTWDQKRKQMEQDAKALGEFMTASTELKQVKQDIATIKSLGGMPTSALNERFSVAKERHELAQAAMRNNKPQKPKNSALTEALENGKALLSKPKKYKPRRKPVKK